MVEDKIIRVVSRESDGSLRTRDYKSIQLLGESQEKIGVDDCSTDLSLRGMPVYRGLIGPIPEGKSIVRYETPQVFECMTKEWADKKVKRRRRRAAVPAPAGNVIAGAAMVSPIAMPETV